MKRIILIAITLFSANFMSAQDTIIKNNGDEIRAKITEITSTDVKYKRFDYQDGPTYIEKKSDVLVIKYANGLKEHFDKQQQQAPANTNRPAQNNYDYYGGPANGPVNPNNKISEYGARYRYQNNMISERDMQEILMETKDKHIMGLVQEAKQAKGLQYIGFGAIPFGIAAVVCLAESQITTINSQTGQYNTNSNARSLQAAAAIFAMVGIACPIASGVFKVKRMNYNRDAIALYNQKY